MIDIEDFIKNGFYFQIHSVRRDINVWLRIADRVPELQNQDINTQHLFSYLQQSAQDNFVLKTSQLFDRPSSQYETICILHFFKYLLKNNEEVTRQFTKYSIEQASKKMKFKLADQELEPSCFLNSFVYHYQGRFQSAPICDLREEILVVRDKFIAHKEFGLPKANTSTTTIAKLIDFAEEIISVFNIAYGGSVYISTPSDEEALFVNESINKILTTN